MEKKYGGRHKYNPHQHASEDHSNEMSGRVSENKEELLHYSTKMPLGLIIFSGFFILITLVMLGASVYFFINRHENEYLFLSVVLLLSAVVLGVVMFPLFYQTFRHKQFIKEFKVLSDRILISSIYPKENRRETEEIYFSDMDWALIGNATQFVPGHRYSKHYNYYAIVILKYGENYFLQDIREEAELNAWVDLLKNRGLPVYYTPYDLSVGKRLHQMNPGDVNFDQIDKVLWDESTEKRPLFTSKSVNEFEYWQIEYYEHAKERKLKEQMQLDQKIKSAFWYSLFIFGVIAGCVMVFVNRGNGILDSPGAAASIFMLSHVFIIGMAASYRHLKWLHLLQFCLVLILANLLGILLSVIVVGNQGDANFIFLTLVFHFTLSIFWVPLFTVIKIIKAIRAKNRKQQVNPEEEMV